MLLTKEKGVPKHSQIHLNPKIKSNYHLPTKKISEKAKSVSSVQSVFKFLSIAEGRWTLLLTDIFILCFSQIILFRVVVVSPAFGVDTNQKKKHGYHLTLIGLSRIFLIIFFFDIILANDSWIGVMDLFGFASVDTLPFLVVLAFEVLS